MAAGDPRQPRPGASDPGADDRVPGAPPTSQVPGAADQTPPAEARCE